MFKYLMPTKIIAGEYAVRDNANELILGRKCMIVTGKTSGVKSGALADVTAALDENNIEYIIYDKIGNNPTIEETALGGEAARKFGCDFLIGIGGGSPLDACKAIAVYATNEPKENGDFDLYDIYKGKYPNKPLPMAAIPTTAGTGSETTPYSILTLHKEETKRSFSSPDVFFKVAFLDGRYTVNLPLQIARNTAIDAMSHLLEGYTNRRASASSDYIALEGLRIIGKHIDALRTGNFNVEICTDLLWAASLGGIVISQTGTTFVHSMGYNLTYYKDIPHGMANGLLLGEYLERCKAVLPEKTSAYEAALGMSLSEIKAFLDECLPCNVSFETVSLDDWAKKSILAKNVPTCPFAVSYTDELEMYKSCLL
jgi:alcohol dehydrogenase class IV